ncbi:MAG: NADH-quinone oxidoreductase subunit NuoF [Defluviitaleaceae bacterium]|nr:NADH-quinone oxidoreductase subunit NuoF [Defluviitaleaceae bacterium]
MKTLAQLEKISDETKKMVELRLGSTKEADKKYHIMICQGTGCLSSQSIEIEKTFKKELEKHNLQEDTMLVKTGCFGICEAGPVIIIYPEGIFYSHITTEQVSDIVEKHLVNGNPIEDMLLHGSVVDGEIIPFNQVSFYKKQKRLALRLCGLINPENIMEYIAFDGYKALAKAVLTMKPEEVIKEMIDSGLRGRGGGGFSTGVKWSFTAKTEDNQKYIVCNGDEGDPGAFMDRSILEGDPNSVIEAMAIAGFATGANHGYVYVRAEYPTAVNRLSKAIEQARDLGLLGKSIFGTNFDFDIEIRLGAGAFVCGEETALLNSIEGFRGMPNPRPPYPAVKGLWGKPTVINNVETFANVPQIILNGSSWFKSIGTDTSKGTKVFALGGKVKNTGLIEVPMGTTLREVIFEVGGGIPGDKKFKAVQTGGPSGGCLTEKELDVPVDFDSLTKLGAMMGSGGMIVMDESNCMVDIAKFFLDFTVEESCGKCAPCRIGTKRMLEILEKISDGKGTLEDLEKLEEIAHNVKISSLCGLGQTAPNPILSTLEHFRDEYIAHIVDKRCPSGTCKNLLSYYILDNCVGCTLCAKNCPVNAISGERKELHHIDTSICIKCNVCLEKCPFKAIEVR